MAGQDPVDFGDEPTNENLTPLERKYKEQMRQIFPQKIDLPISTLPEMIKEQINLNPEFQRRDRWDQLKQSRFIESIIMNVPIPPVFLGEDQYGTYVVLDGRQRLTAINEFLKNTYALKGLEVWEDINGNTFNDLQKKKLDKAITRRFVPAVIILKESSPQVKYDVFDRLNTGGVIAEEMEIRNAVFPGPFCNLIRELSEDQEFRKLWDIPADPEELEKNNLYRKMSDMELVLRFFALSDYAAMDMKFKDYLSDFMAKRNLAYLAQPELAANDRERFLRAVRNCWTVFGKLAFRKEEKSQKSAPLADAMMIALAACDPAQVSARAPNIRKAIQHILETHDDFKKAFGTGTNGKGAIRTRIEVATATVTKTLE